MATSVEIEVYMVPKYSKIDLETEIFDIFDLLQCVT